MSNPKEPTIEESINFVEANLEADEECLPSVKRHFQNIKSRVTELEELNRGLDYCVEETERKATENCAECQVSGMLAEERTRADGAEAALREAQTRLKTTVDDINLMLTLLNTDEFGIWYNHFLDPNLTAFKKDVNIVLSGKRLRWIVGGEEEAQPK